jgi:hypothetical protein
LEKEKKKESNPLRDDGDNPSLSSPPSSLGNGDRCESRGEEQDASCCVFIFHKRCAPDSQKKKKKKKKRSGGVVAKCYLYPSCERNRVQSCVYIFFDNQNPLAERKRRNGRECYGPRNPFGSFIYHNGAGRRKRKRKKKERKKKS